jgi:hypothetical protein
MPIIRRALSRNPRDTGSSAAVDDKLRTENNCERSCTILNLCRSPMGYRWSTRFFAADADHFPAII